MAKSIRRNLPGIVSAIGIAAALSACTSTFAPQPAATTRPLDYRNDDMAGLVVAIDVPVAIQPVPEMSLVAFSDLTSGAGERLTAPLSIVDPGEAAGSLPPPANGRTYYLFGFSETDKLAIREAQARTGNLPAVQTAAPTSLPVSITTSFCALEAIDPQRETFSVFLVTSSGAGLQPLVKNETVASAVARSSEPLAAC